MDFAQERRRERTARYQLDGRDAAKDSGAGDQTGCGEKEKKGKGVRDGPAGRTGEPMVEKPEGLTLQDELEWTRKQLELERLRMRAMQSTSHGDSRSHPRR